MSLLRLGMNLKEEDIFCSSSNDIKIGEPYIDVIRENFNGSKFVFLLISKNFMSSPFCICEIGAAWASNKVILPILIDVDYSAIKYPSTPIKQRQVGKLEDKDTLISIFDSLKDHGIVTGKLTTFTKQFDAFMSKKLWLNQVRVKPIIEETPSKTTR